MSATVAQTDFAINLLKSASEQTAIISPFSIGIALAMVYTGSDGRTKQQMMDILAKGFKFGTYDKKACFLLKL